eukprot:3966520-Prymnesium_polylepis.2
MEHMIDAQVCERESLCSCSRGVKRASQVLERLVAAVSRGVACSCMPVCALSRACVCCRVPSAGVVDVE